MEGQVTGILRWVSNCPEGATFSQPRLRKSVGLFINLQEAYAPSLLQSSIPLESSLLLPSLLANSDVDVLRLDGDTLTKVASFPLPGHPASMRGSTP